MADSKNANSHKRFLKCQGLVLGLERLIDWCKEHWCGSTYMVVRLSGVSSKTGKKCIFCVFRLFLRLCQTASKPYRFSHINVLCINQSYLLTQGSIPDIFEKILRIGGIKKLILVFRFFCFIPMKISQSFLCSNDWSKFWWLPWFVAQNNSCINICNTVQCKACSVNDVLGL